jgi:hypothetical protein
MMINSLLQEVLVEAVYRAVVMEEAEVEEDLLSFRISIIPRIIQLLVVAII